MKFFVLAAAALFALSAPAGAQEAMKPCKPPRHASITPAASQPPAAQEATGSARTQPTGQMANSAACEQAPPDTR